jgi:pentatricopeptide repeat protein
LLRRPIIDPATNKARYLKLPPASVCNKVLDSVSQVEDPDLITRAADLAGALQLEGVGVEARTAQSLIHGLAHVGMVDKGIELLDGWMNANIDVLEDDDAAQEGPAHVMATLLEAAARADDTDAITQVLLRMARVGLSPSPHTMTTLLQCFSRLGNINTAHSMLQWMRRSGIEPQAVHYAALMTLPAVTVTGTKAQNFLTKAKEAYQDLKAHDIQPTAYFYAAYINVLSRLRDLDAARDAWLDMERVESIEPDLVCYTTMIDACAKGGDVDGAFHLYGEMQKHGIKPDAVVFATLISAVSLKIDQAKDIWSDMKKEGIVPDTRTVSVYLDALLKSGEYQDALELLKESSAQNISEKANAVGAVASLYEQAISFAALSREKHGIELLKSIINQMKAVNVPFTTHSVTSLLTARAQKLHKQKLFEKESNTAAVPWHTDVDVDSTAGGGKYKALNLGSGEVIDELLGSIEEATEDASSTAAITTTIKPTPDAAAVSIGCLSVEGSMQQALDLYSQYSESMHGSVRIWTLKMLLAGAMATENQQQQVALILKVVGEARKFSKLPSSGGWWWNQRTQKLIARQLKKAPEARGLVGEETIASTNVHPHKLVERPMSS